MYPSYGGYGGGYGGGAGTSIPLDVHPPQFPSAANYIGALMNIQSMQQMRQLREAEIQNQNLATEERRRNLEGETLAGQIIRGQQQPPAATPSEAPAPAGAIPPQAPAPAPQAPPPQIATPPTPSTFSSNSMAAVDPGQWWNLTRGMDPSAPNQAPAGSAPPASAATPAATPGATPGAGAAQQPAQSPSAPPPVTGDAIGAKLKAGNTLFTQEGYPVTNVQAFRQQMYQAGYGKLGEKMADEMTQAQLRQSQLYKSQLDTAQGVNQAIADAVQPFALGVMDKGTTDEQHQNSWTAARNRLLQIQGPNGQPIFDEKQVPTSYMAGDPGQRPLDLAPQWFQQTGTSQQMIAQHQMAVENYNKAVQGQIKTQTDFRNYANSSLAAASSPTDVSHAMLVLKQSTGLTNQQLASYFPTQQNPDGSLQLDANQLPVPMFSAELKKQAQSALMGPYKEQTLDVKQQAQDTRQQGQDTRDLAQNTRQQAQDLRQEIFDWRQQVAAAKPPTPAERTAMLSGLAERALSDSAAGGGKTIDDAKANVLNRGFYENDPMDPYRQEVANLLETWKDPALRTQALANTAGKGKGGTWRDNPLITGAPSTGPTTGATAAPGTPLPKSTAIPGATQPSTVHPQATYTEADVRQRATARHLDPDAAVALARKNHLIP